MRIRAARAEDAIEACDVVRRSITELCEADHANDPALLARWLANKTPENVGVWIKASHVFVAEEGSRIIGVAALTSLGHLTLNYVAQEARFRGISRALLREAEGKARDLGCRVCTLQSTKTAERFYRTAGYRERSNLPQGVLGKLLVDARGEASPGT